MQATPIPGPQPHDLPGADLAAQSKRIALMTLRASETGVFRCAGYEYEDAILGEFDNGHLVEPVLTRHPGARLQRMLDRHILPGRHLRFGAGATELGEDVDLFFVYPALLADLNHLYSVRDWRARAKVAICHLQEAWCNEATGRIAEVLPVLRQFDHIYCPMYHTVELLRRLTGVPVTYLPWGIDAETMCPWPANVGRVIDVSGIGKIDPTTHRQLWAWARDTGRYYSYSTTENACYSISHRHHRMNFVQTLQRSRYFLAYMAKRTIAEHRGQQQEFGLRYLEGAAAGAIQLGDQLADNPGFAQHLDWDGSVIDAPYGAADLPRVIAMLEDNPDWLERVRRRGVINCLRRHDHVYRWAEMLRCAGLGETPAMAERRKRLEYLAREIEAGEPEANQIHEPNRAKVQAG